MSTILKALQRLEDEKSAKLGRSLEQRVVAQRAPAERGRRGLWLGAAVLASLALAATALWLWGGGPGTQGGEARETHAAAGPRAPEDALAAAQAVHDAERVDAARAAARERAAERSKRRRSARSGDEAVAHAPAAAAAEIPLVEVVKRLDEPPAASPSGVQSDSVAERELEARVASALARDTAADQESETARQAAAAEHEAAASRIAAAQREAIASRTAAAEREAAALQAAAVQREAAARHAAAEQAEAATAPGAATQSAARGEAAAISAANTSAAAGAPAPASAARDERDEWTASARRDARVVERAALPELAVSRTVWHPDAERRLAVVRSIESGEEVRLRIGDAYGPLVVEAILPSGVLFDHEGVDIQYSVGR